MRKKHKVLAVLIGSAVFTSAARLSYSYIRFSNVERRFHRVKVGESRQEVERILGEPNYHDGPCETELHTPPKGCVRDAVYSHPLAPLMPDYYILSFSKEDRVIEAERITSP